MATVIYSRSAAIAWVNTYASLRIHDIARRWLPDGRLEGRVWIARSPTHPDCGPDSLKVMLWSEEWIDYATGAKGEDVLTLISYVAGLSLLDAVVEVASLHGVQIDKYAPAVWPDKIRALNQLDGPDGTIEKGETVEIADIGRWDVEAWIECGDAEPVFNLAFKPDLPTEGCSFEEAYRRHVEGDPNVSALLRATGRDLELGRLHVAQYREPPCHPGSSVVWSPSVVWSVEEDGHACCLDLIRFATHKLVKRFMDAELVAMGVWQRGPNQPEMIAITRWWWVERDVALNVAKGELWEYVVVEGKKKKWVLCFTHVRVYHAGDLLPAGEAKQPGPRSKNLEMIEAFERLCKGKAVRTQKKIARNMTKKEIWRVVLEEIGVAHGVRGYGYDTFLNHVGLLIDNWTREPTNR